MFGGQNFSQFGAALFAAARPGGDLDTFVAGGEKHKQLVHTAQILAGETIATRAGTNRQLSLTGRKRVTRKQD